MTPMPCGLVRDMCNLTMEGVPRAQGPLQLGSPSAWAGDRTCRPLPNAHPADLDWPVRRRCRKLGDLAAQNETDDADDKPEQEWNAPVLCVQRLGRHQLRDRRSRINTAANWPSARPAGSS